MQDKHVPFIALVMALVFAAVGAMLSDPEPWFSVPVILAIGALIALLLKSASASPPPYPSRVPMTPDVKSVATSPAAALPQPAKRRSVAGITFTHVDLTEDERRRICEESRLDPALLARVAGEIPDEIRS